MRNKDHAIEVNDVKKAFKVYYDRGITVKDKALSRGRGRYELREVLRGISFEVKKGEAIGLIGKNGCGKSTTLKLLTKIIYPNEGSIELSGRVSSLLELGAGFHPDMSGRENIYMNAAVFGLNRKEIEKRVKDIIRFSELEDYIENPVRTYSSGMYMRLAFSVAINVDADVLLIDEILAVGDISFQKKCFEKLKEIKMNGATIVIVSHSLDQIEKICDRCIWIEDGRIKEQGKPREVDEHYLFSMEEKRLERFQEECYENIGEDEQTEEKVLDSEEDVKVEAENIIEQQPANIAEDVEFTEENEVQNEVIDKEGEDNSNIQEEILGLKKNFLDGKRIVHEGNQKLMFTELYITSETGEEKVYFETGEGIKIYAKYVAKKPDLKGTLCLLIYRDDGIYCYGTNTFIEKKEVLQFRETGLLKVDIAHMPLLPGKYFFTIAAHDEDAAAYDTIQKAAAIQLFSTKGDEGVVRVDTDWSIE